MGINKQIREYFLEKSGLFLVLIILALAAVLINLLIGVNFYQPSNLLNILRSFSMLCLASLGQMVVIVIGGLDLSVGEVISASNVLAATVMAGQNDLLFTGIMTVTVFAIVVGIINGLLVTKRNVPPFIATLGVATVLKGIRLLITNGLPNGQIPENLKTLGTGYSFNLPNLFFVFLVGAILFYLMLGRTGMGRRLYAVGTNMNVATLSGIRSERYIILSYVICSVSAAFVGVLLGGYTGMADQKIGDGYDIQTIASAVLGGAVIGGGVGSVSGTVIGTLIMLIVTNLTVLAQFPIQSQMLIQGLLIVIALWFNKKK
jgi:ribose/xylose/arabinose/galactoside ABC-type transport system permease subunit